jgi:hypothetical protein
LALTGCYYKHTHRHPTSSTFAGILFLFSLFTPLPFILLFCFSSPPPPRRSLHGNRRETARERMKKSGKI